MKYNLKKYIPNRPTSHDKEINREFSILNFFIRNDSISKSSKPDMFKNKSTFYISVMKRLLTDIFFLNYFWDPEKFPNPVLVVIGAKTGDHYPLLAEMFPSIKIHLYDVSDFSYKSTDVIVLHEEKFNPSDWSGEDFYMISRISTDNRINDMKLQKKWVDKLKPIKSMLRVDFSQDNHHFDYYDGYSLIPPWDRLDSNEIYLIPTDDLDMRRWNPNHVRNQLSYHHNIVRQYHNYVNIFSENFDEYYEEELINTRWDDTCTIYILMDYLNKFLHENIDQSYVNGLLLTCYNIINEYGGEIPNIGYHKTNW